MHNSGDERRTSARSLVESLVGDLVARSSLHVGELLGDATVTDAEHVHAPHVAVRPRVVPELYHAISRDNGVLDLEPVGLVVDDRLPGPTDLLAPPSFDITGSNSAMTLSRQNPSAVLARPRPTRRRLPGCEPRVRQAWKPPSRSPAQCSPSSRREAAPRLDAKPSLAPGRVRADRMASGLVLGIYPSLTW